MSTNTIKFAQPVRVGLLAADPSAPENGMIYYNTTTNTLRQFVNSTWAAIAAGSVSLTGQTLNQFNILIGNASNLSASVDASALGNISADTTNGLLIKSNVITNSMVNSAAAIAYSKLNLSASIVNADIATAAAIAYSKLALSNSIVNADINTAAAIAYSKLNLASSIVNADVSATAAIAYSKLANLGGSTNAVLTQDAGGKVQASGILSGNLFLADGSVTATAAFNLGGFKVTNAANPTNPQDLVTKSYADNLSASLSWKTAARAGSVANLTLSSMPATVDGITLISGDRFLAKNQTAGAENGIYIFNGTAAAASRATDMVTWNEVVGAVLLVVEGTVNAGSKWVDTNIAGGTLGTTAITFTAFSIAGTVGGSGTSGYVAYWNGTSNLTAEQYLSATRGGLATDASAFTGILHASAGVFTASLIVNADVSASAAIAYSKLALSNSIVNADINAAAAIVYSKLSLANSIVNADIGAAAAIAYSKLNLSASIVNADIATGAAIAYSKLALSNSIVNTDIATGAAIALSKLAALTANRALLSDGTGIISVSAVTNVELGYVSGVTSAIQTQINTKIASVSADTTPALGGNLNMSGFALLGLQHNAAVASPANWIETEYIHSTTLTAATTAVATNFTFAQASFNAIELNYYALEASTGQTRKGRLEVTTNGATTSIIDSFTETALVGVTWTCAQNGSNIELTYTVAGANAVTMRTQVTRFKA